jgi:hypothetical protein
MFHLDRWNLFHPNRPASEDPAVARNHVQLAIYKDGDNTSEGTDAGGQSTELLIAVQPGVLRVKLERFDWNILKRQQF